METDSQTKDLPEEIVITVSDMHLAAGLMTKNNTRNSLEEFEADGEFFHFLEKVTAKYSGVPKLRLVLLGDIFDSQAILFKGRNMDTPYEVVHRYKMKRVLSGHPLFFAALKIFLARQGASVDFYIGNHDFFVEWKSVQKMIVDAISNGSPEKVRFLYKEERKGVHYFHGNFEPHSATNMKQIYITERFGIKLKRPLLNYPYGTTMTVDLTNRLKKKNRLIGRLRSHDPVWRDCLMRDWWFGVYALALIVWYSLYNRFFAIWDVRQKARLSTTIKMILWTITGYDLKEYSRRVFSENPEIKVVICGHDHEASRITVSGGPKSGTYINTGTWTKFFDNIEEPIIYKWKHFRETERLWRSLRNFSKRPKMKAVTRLTFALIEHFPDGGLNARLMEFHPRAPEEKQIIEVI